MKKHSLLGPIIAMIVPYIFFEAIRSGALLDPEFFKPEGHFYIVTAVAVLATFIAIAIGIAGRRLRNINVTFLALSFISLAQMFSVHGLSTPHFILPKTHLPGVSAQLSMVLATIWLMFSSLPRIVG